MLNKFLALLLALVLVSPSWGAVEFDGTTDYLTRTAGISGIPSGQDKSFTVSFWIKIAAANQFGSIILEEPTNERWLIFLSDGSIIARVCDGSCGDARASSSFLPINEWLHVAVVYRSYLTGIHYAETSIYVNGVNRSDCTAAANCVQALNSTGNQIDIAYLRDVSSYDFEGQLDDIRLYNRSLAPGRFTGLNTFVLDSEWEILELYHSRSRLTITDGLLAWWKLDEGTDGQTVLSAIDFSGNGNHLTSGGGTPKARASSWINYP